MIEARLWLAAAVCAVLGLALGLAVASGTPSFADSAAFALRGRATRSAQVFTTIGRGWVTTSVALGALAAAYALQRGVVAVGLVVVAQAVSQAVNTLLKLAYRRARPVEWYGYQEHDLSYPSGHANTSVVLFAGLAVLAAAGVPGLAGVALAALLAVTAVGIAWSRLALGAHYLTDVTGGALLGTAWLCAALALAHHVASIAAINRG